MISRLVGVFLGCCLYFCHFVSFLVIGGLVISGRVPGMLLVVSLSFLFWCFVIGKQDNSPLEILSQAGNWNEEQMTRQIPITQKSAPLSLSSKSDDGLTSNAGVMSSLQDWQPAVSKQMNIPQEQDPPRLSSKSEAVSRLTAKRSRKSEAVLI